MCKFRFRLVHWIDPRSIEHSYACYLSNALDRPTNQFIPSVSLSVCVSVNRSALERLRPQFFADFHEILYAAPKCGRYVSCCLWDKPEVVCWFYRLAVFRLYDHIFQQISTKFHIEIKVSNADFVFNGEWNRKWKSNFRYVQIPDSVSISALWNDYSLQISPNFTHESEVWCMVFWKP